jgi:hypothetical protein
MNKAQIRSQLLGILNRNDCDNPTADNFIDLALSRIQRTLRIAPMERQQVYTSNDVGDDLLVLPEDFLSMKYIWSGQDMLEYKDFATFLKYPIQQGSPKIYTRVRGGIQVRPVPPLDTVINMIYYGEFDDLPNETSENSLTNFAPDLLIYGGLSFAADYFVDDRKGDFEARYAAIYNEVEEQSRTVEWDQASLAIQPVHPYVNY